ncbi:MAG TPA: LssY C-terminal domain-containing protein [Bryobacteraceae bacterium]|nr:LssY C-terminal domain-containing protein [Bryobacteraceae bacterium]
MYSFALLAVSLMGLHQVPTGAQFHIRLTTPVGSYASKAGDPVDGILIAPVLDDDGQTLFPDGSAVKGRVERVKRVGLGLKHETATLDVVFNQIILPNGATRPLASRVYDVDNGRERVTDDGSILGVRSTATIGYRVSGYIRTMLAWEIHSQIFFWTAKMLLVHVPEPEIYYPAGSELTLALTQPEYSRALREPGGQLTAADDEQLRRKVAEMPYRTMSRSGKPSDLINMIFIGTRQEIEDAFTAAGWTVPSPATLRARFVGARAVVEGLGYPTAPISNQTLNDRPPDLAWQKNLNDVAKRHHVRIWKQSQTWEGREIWVGAATHDVDYAYLRHGSSGVTHRIEQDIDRERDKIAYDLQFTSCTSLVDWWDRPGAPLEARNATGDPMSTDGRLAVVRMNECRAPRLTVADAEALPKHGRFLQRLLRREILSVRSDYYRTNLYWRSYEGTRWVVLAVKHRYGRSRKTDADPESPANDKTALERAFNSSWLR